MRPFGRDLPGPHRCDGPVEVGPRRAYRPSHAGGSAGRRRRLPGPLRRRRAQARHGDEDGAAADHLCHGQSGSGDHPARGQGSAPRRDHRHRPIGLSEPGQQRAGLPLHLPRRTRRARHRDQRGDEDRRRPGARQPRAPAGARGGRRRLWRCRAAFRAGLYHPGAVRSAPDGGRPCRRRRGGDADRGRAPPDRGHGRLSRDLEGPAQPDHGRADDGLCRRARQPEARRLRRGRGRGGAARRDRLPRRRLRHAGAGRPRRGARAAARARHRRSVELRTAQ